MAMSWQLRDLHGNYEVYVVVTELYTRTWQPTSKRHVERDPGIAPLTP